MPGSMERLSSRHNPLVARFRASARGGPDAPLLLDGAHLLEEALDAGLALDVVAFGERHLAGRLEALAARVAASGVQVVSVTAAVLAAMSPVRQPSGVVALARRPRASLEDVFAGVPALILLLAAVQDPGNVGAIIRAADACGATGIACDAATADPFGWKALRGAMGSTFRVPAATGAALDEAIAGARQRGLRVYAAIPRGGTPLPQSRLGEPCAILLGGEGPGVPAGLVGLADDRLSVPMRGPVDSLNVAVAAALVLYEASRQRGAAQ